MNNWKTTLTGIASALIATLTILASLPYSIGELAEIIPSEWKPKIVTVGLISTLILRIINAINQQDAGKTPQLPGIPSGSTPVDATAQANQILREGRREQTPSGKEGNGPGNANSQ